MPWVNIFNNEACEVVVGLRETGNDFPPDPGDVFSFDSEPSTPAVLVDDFGLYAGPDGPVIGLPDSSRDVLNWGTYIIPSGGIAGRRFRARVLQQTSAVTDPESDAGLIQCPGYFVEGCGLMAAHDEAALVPYNPNGNPPVDSEWYEFEEVAAEPDAGGLENTGWVGLFNYDNFGWYSDVARGLFEWQVWVDETPPVGGGLPWWLCVPKPPVEPCPVRPTDFVPFSEYDADFKFPLQSSRKPSTIVRPDGCVVCAPTLIGDTPDPGPEPEPTCVEMVLASGAGNNYEIPSDELLNLPDWFIATDSFVIDFSDGYPTAEYLINEHGNWVLTNPEDDQFNGEASGEGTLIQGSNTICITWFIPAGV